MRNITLRSSYKTLSVSEVQSMPNVSIRVKDEGGFWGHSTINHDYNLKTVGGDMVVADNATGLMWHQNGADDAKTWYEAKGWIKKLNKRGYAGYRDWRLPTLDEAVSLLESSRINGDLYIDPVFSKKQTGILTGDKFDGSEVAWLVFFDCGGVFGDYIVSYGYYYVRPVRSVR